MLDMLGFSKALCRIFVWNGLQGAKKGEALPMQDKSNVDCVKPVKAAKRHKAAG